MHLPSICCDVSSVVAFRPKPTKRNTISVRLNLRSLHLIVRDLPVVCFSIDVGFDWFLECNLVEVWILAWFASFVEMVDEFIVKCELLCPYVDFGRFLCDRLWNFNGLSEHNSLALRTRYNLQSSYGLSAELRSTSFLLVVPHMGAEKTCADSAKKSASWRYKLLICCTAWLTRYCSSVRVSFKRRFIRIESLVEHWFSKYWSISLDSWRRQLKFRANKSKFFEFGLASLSIITLIIYRKHGEWDLIQFHGDWQLF